MARHSINKLNWPPASL